MRKFLLSFIVSVVVTNGYAQLQKVPANATMVARYSGKSLSQKLSVKKIDSYAFVQDHLLKALKLDSLGSLDNTGISLDKDIFQYVSWQDSSMNFVTLFNLKDARLFTKLLQANISANVKSEGKAGMRSCRCLKTLLLAGMQLKQYLLLVSMTTPAGMSIMEQPTPLLLKQ